MREIDVLLARFSAAGGIPDTLAASWDCFELVQALADAYADQAPDMFAAFMLVAVAAADGQDAIGSAPSMPDGPGEPGPLVDADGRDVRETADELASFMTVLSRLLETAASCAGNPGDRETCGQAARAARHIRDLLAPEQP